MRIICGDVMRFAAHYRGNRFHGVLCDPPYELGFMGRSWDSRGVSFRAETWSAIRSLLAPGAHLLAFGGTRTFHRIAVAIEDAGFEIRDTIGWLYGSGFPKSHDVSKAIGREAGAEREVIHSYQRQGRSAGILGKPTEITRDITTPATDAARAWQGYGTALKPAWEPVIVARNPLVGTVAQNAIEHGAGALNVDGGRVGSEEIMTRGGKIGGVAYGDWAMPVNQTHIGRWPANILHDGSDEVAEVMGDAQRFFYCAKAGKRERDEGLSGFAKIHSQSTGWSGDAMPLRQDGSERKMPLRANHHPTVKPLALTEYLAKLILPPASIGERRILVPFAGSGSECIGAIRAGWRHVVGVEQNDEYARIARARIDHELRREI